MGYQFLHVESYAREAGKSKAGGHSIRSIIAEATREPGVAITSRPRLLPSLSSAARFRKSRRWLPLGGMNRGTLEGMLFAKTAFACLPGLSQPPMTWTPRAGNR